MKNKKFEDYWIQYFSDPRFNFMRKISSTSKIDCKIIEKDIPKDICNCYQHGQFICKLCCKDISENILQSEWGATYNISE